MMGNGGLVSFTAKRLYRTAQGFNPGYDAKRDVPRKRHQSSERLGNSVRHFPELTFLGRRFQGTSFSVAEPGLKPWAVLYNRFAVNTAATP